MILVYRDDTGDHWEVLNKTTRLIGNRLRAEVDAALVRKLQSRPFAIIVLADNGSRSKGFMKMAGDNSPAIFFPLAIAVTHSCLAYSSQQWTAVAWAKRQ